MKKKHGGFAVLLIISISALLLAVNLMLGFILVNQSRRSIKTLIDSRMLDIANTAADMIDGDTLASLKKEDKGTPHYQKINDTLAVFQDNIDLKYIYCVRAGDDGSFTFTVDPTVADPGEFGEPVVSTKALRRARDGHPAVDEEPYSDDWGRFYSAYSPVKTSNGKVTEIVAVDFSAEWYNEQIASQTKAILIFCIFAVAIGILLTLIATHSFRKRLRIINADLIEVAMNVEDLNHDINPDLAYGSNTLQSTDNVRELGQRIRRVRDDLKEYRLNVHSQAKKMIMSLSSDYRGVYFIELDKDEGVCYQGHSLLKNGLNQGDHFPYLSTLLDYGNKYVTDEYRDAFMDFVEPTNIKRSLTADQMLTLLYMVRIDGREYYEMVRVAEANSAGTNPESGINGIGMAFTDVDDEMRRTLSQSQALSDALAAAESANMAKTAFLSNMSHEIRTPLNAIIGLDKIALEDDNLLESTRDHLKKIGASADHLLALINDILDMSRIEAGRMSLRNEVFSLPVLLDQVQIIIGGQCRDKGLTWKCETEGENDVFYSGDDVKLKQVLINILGNGVKFTEPGGTVSLNVKRTAHYEGRSVFCFTMSDTGIGMSEEFLPILFDPFSQEDDSVKSKYGSTGLGMSISRSIVELMNGEISVESKKGEGTTFNVSVTLTDVDQAKYEKEHASPEELKKQIVQDAAETAEEYEVNLEDRRVLLAEDMEINAEIMGMIFEMREIEVDYATNGEEAVEMFEESPVGYYDAIFMDMRMPKMDGLEATKVIRRLRREDAITIPIIALTANAFDEDVQRSLQAGLNAHLSKPVDPDNLFETLEEFIR